MKKKTFENIESEQMRQKLRQFIVETFLSGKGILRDDEPLFASGIIDSLGFIKLLAFIEKSFSISINMSEVVPEKFDTLNKIMETVGTKIK